MRTFIIVWFSQLLSLLGSGLSQFSLIIWVYQETNSISQYALLGLATGLPILIFSPFTGTVADRINRRYLMILGDLVAGLSICILTLLLISNQLQVWHIYLLNWRCILEG